MSSEGKTTTGSTIALQDVWKSYGKQMALAPTTFSIPPRATTVLIGPSGCGKSTLLRLIMGLIQPDAGEIRFGKAAMTPGTANELRHRIGYVIQDGGLFPHLTAEQNVTLLARYLRRPQAEIDRRVGELAELTRLPRESLARFPAELSGGQRQRVGLMRALLLDPGVLLLDEPLGALDPITRYELQTELKSIFDRLQKTVVLVTHDMGEAAYFGDEIVLMREGRIVQHGTLDDLMRRPAERYVVDFIRAQRAPLMALAGEGNL